MTHAWINRQAWLKLEAAGNALPHLPGFPDDDKARKKLETYGAMPDAISLHALIKEDHAYDALHSLVPFGHNGDPLFGRELLKAATTAGDTEAQLAAYGWCCHQIADSVVHYGGYCESLPTFGSLFPGNSQRDEVARRVLRDIDHGLTEILGDVAAASGPGGDLVQWGGLDCPGMVVEEASRQAGGVPLLDRRTWHELVDEFATTLRTLVVMARALRHAPFGNQTAAQAILAHYDGPDGQVKADGGQGWGLTQCRHEAVDLVAAFLADPTAARLRASAAPRTPRGGPLAGLPTGTTAGLPQLGGVLPYRLAQEIQEKALGLVGRAAGLIPWAPDSKEDDVVLWGLHRLVDMPGLAHTFAFRVLRPIVKGFEHEVPVSDVRQDVVQALPPLVDATASFPAPGAATKSSACTELRLELVDVAQEASDGSCELRVDAVRVNEHPVAVGLDQVAWDGARGVWTLRIPVGHRLAPAHYQVEVEGLRPPDKPFRYEWEFSVEA